MPVIIGRLLTETEGYDIVRPRDICVRDRGTNV